MIDINCSLFWQIGVFLFMIIAMNHLVYRPIRQIIKERNAKFTGFESDIASMLDKIAEQIKEIESRVTEARRDGFQRKDEIKDQGLEEEKTILSRASDEAEAEIQKVRDRIKDEISAARQTLKEDLAVFSAEVARKVLGRSLS
jgi:F-type H+-transporting ATPase subunit b